MTDFHNTLYERFTFRDSCKAVLQNFLTSGIKKVVGVRTFEVGTT
jgi:hypothetical protein